MSRYRIIKFYSKGWDGWYCKLFSGLNLTRIKTTSPDEGKKISLAQL